jgi:hypothetical protein
MPRKSNRRSRRLEQDEYYKEQCRLQAKYWYLRVPKSGRAGGLAPELAAELDALPGYPLSRLQPGAAVQLYGDYDFARLALTRVDAAIDFLFSVFWFSVKRSRCWPELAG